MSLKHYPFLIVFLLSFAIFFMYLGKANPPFPGPPPSAAQSNEPADTEDPNRRAYFTDYTREQVVAHYLAQWQFLPTLRLNYPPEEAQTLIRDQTRSSYLEEIVHPFRTSIYINGFIPTSDKDTIIINGQHYEQKIIIKYVPSSIYMRLAIASLMGVFIFLLYSYIFEFIKHFSLKSKYE